MDVKIYANLAAAAAELEKAQGELFFHANGRLFFGDPRKVNEPGSDCRLLFEPSTVEAIGSVQRVVNGLNELIAPHRKHLIAAKKKKFEAAMLRVASAERA